MKVFVSFVAVLIGVAAGAVVEPHVNFHGLSMWGRLLALGLPYVIIAIAGERVFGSSDPSRPSEYAWHLFDRFLMGVVIGVAVTGFSV